MERVCIIPTMSMNIRVSFGSFSFSSLSLCSSATPPFFFFLWYDVFVAVLFMLS